MMPDVAAQNVELIERWVAVTGAELRPDNDQGLVPVQNALRELSLWPGEAQRIQKQGRAWRVQDADWSMHLGIRSAVATPAVQVMLAEERVYLADGQRWIHQADFLLATHGETDLPLALPAGAQLLGLTLDDQPVAVRPAGVHHYWVPVGWAFGRTCRPLRVGGLSRERKLWHSPTWEAHTLSVSPHRCSRVAC